MFVYATATRPKRWGEGKRERGSRFDMIGLVHTHERQPIGGVCRGKGCVADNGVWWVSLKGRSARVKVGGRWTQNEQQMAETLASPLSNARAAAMMATRQVPCSNIKRVIVRARIVGAGQRPFAAWYQYNSKKTEYRASRPVRHALRIPAPSTSPASRLQYWTSASHLAGVTCVVQKGK